MPHRPSHRRLANINDIEAVLRAQHERAVAFARTGARSTRVLYPNRNVNELADIMVPSSAHGPGRGAALKRALADSKEINRVSRKRARRALRGIAPENLSGAGDAIAQAKLSTRKRAGVIARTEKKRLLASILVPERREQGYTHVRLSDGVEFDDECAAANGAVWTIGEYESHPTEHPNCRRTVVAWLKGPEGRG